VQTTNQTSAFPPPRTGALQDKPPVQQAVGPAIYSVLSVFDRRGIATGEVRLDCFRPKPDSCYATCKPKSPDEAIAEYVGIQSRRLAALRDQVNAMEQQIVNAGKLRVSLDVVA
jgi:hypothetical protein